MAANVYIGRISICISSYSTRIVPSSGTLAYDDREKIQDRSIPPSLMA